jgi:hypothetical protein
MTVVSKEIIELSGKSFENTRDLLGDLLGAKNAGVTPCIHGLFDGGPYHLIPLFKMNQYERI